MYKHGVYAQIGQSQAHSTAKVNTAPVYVGTLPVHLARGFADKEKRLINVPLRVYSLSDASNKIPLTGSWEDYTLLEAIDAHFNNSIENVGPIYLINVLDPGEMRKQEKTTSTLAIVNSKAVLADMSAILDTATVKDGETLLVENVDYTMKFNPAKGAIDFVFTKQSLESAAIEYFQIDLSLVTPADIVGGTSQDVHTGAFAVSYMFVDYNAVPTVLLAPKWSEIPLVHDGLITAASKIDGHWEAQVYADIPLSSKTLEAAIAWRQANGYTSERTKVFYPQAKKRDKIYHISTLAALTKQRVDNLHQGVPFETASNKDVDITGMWLGGASNIQMFSQQQASELNANGITTLLNWTTWRLWGNGTGKFEYGANIDPRAIFDVYISMLYYIANDFQLFAMRYIDKPFTVNLKDAILNAYQERMDALVSMGALYAGSKVLFIQDSNPTGDLIQGNFRFDFATTPVPPANAVTLVVSYTDEGFKTLFE